MATENKVTTELDSEFAAALKRYAAREYSRGYYAGSMKRWRELEAEVDKLKSQNETLMNNQIRLMQGMELRGER